ncbi:MAG: ABC transporter ATP-binding protein [Thiolinea sp.]
MSIYCDDVSITLADKAVIRGLNFRQEEPALIGLLGCNGAGKTTLMRALAGLQAIDAGQLRVNGLNPQREPVQLAKSMAYLPQQRVVHWALPVADVVMLGRMPHQRAFYPPNQRDHEVVQQVMAEMDVSQFARRPFQTLSGGEQARVLIARALAQEPSLLIADEPANGLDPAHQVAMMRYFQCIVAGGCTVLLSVHDLNLAARYCDRLVMLDEGKVYQDGTPEVVMTAEHLQQVFNVRADIRHIDGCLAVSVVG